MTTDTIIIRQHVAAISAMLLGNRRMKNGVTILAGEPLDMNGRLEVGLMAKQTNNDIIHLEFGDAADGTHVLSGINIMAPRDIAVYIQTECRLWLSRSGTRAIILPRPEVRGHFRLSPRELIHVDSKPADIEEGIRRAEDRLRKLVTRGAFPIGQVEIADLPIAA